MAGDTPCLICRYVIAFVKAVWRKGHGKRLGQKGLVSLLLGAAPRQGSRQTFAPTWVPLASPHTLAGTQGLGLAGLVAFQCENS